MSELTLTLDRDGAATLVEQIVAALTGAIERKLLRAGQALPSIRALAATHSLSAFTVAEAYNRLVAARLIVARRGSGYRVADPEPPAPQRQSSYKRPSLNAAWLLSDVFADHSVPIKAGCGWLPAEWINEGGLHQAIRALGRVPGPRLGGYGHPYGLNALRDYIAATLRRYALPVDSANILLTQGATQALDLIVRTLLRAGDTVLVEDPGYCNLLQILKLAGLKVVGVPRTVEGLDIDVLEQRIREHAPKAIFVNPVLQNPSGASLTMTAAFRLLQIADKHGLWVIEDDVSRELAPAGAPCLAALEGLRRVIYVSGYAKTVTPTLRVGYVAADLGLLAELARTKMAVGLTSSEVAERLTLNALVEGHYDRHVDLIRDKLKTAHQHVVEQMRKVGIQPFHTPQAGLFLWAQLPIAAAHAHAVTTEALAQGIWLAPGSYFRPQEQASSWFRFNAATSAAPELWAFLRQLAERPHSLSA
jgi:DNA-binding transcriptional MocR family regulator